MNLVVRIALALLSIATLAVMLHHGILATRRPQSLVGLERRFRDSRLQKVYLALLIGGWVYAGYRSGIALFAWIPVETWYEDGSYYNPLAAAVGFVALFIPIALGNFAEAQVRASLLESEIKELEAEARRMRELASEPVSAADEVELLREEWNSASEGRAKKFAERILRVAESQFAAAQRARKRILQELQDAERLATLGREEGAKKLARERDQAAFLSKLDSAMSSYRGRSAKPVISSLGELPSDGSDHLLDRQVVNARWKALSAAAKSTIRLTDVDISQGFSAPYDASALLRATAGTHLSAGVRLTASYSGDSHGGATELFGVLPNGEKRAWVEVLRFESSLDGVVEAFFLAHALPRFGVHWHGLYERDHTFLSTDNQLRGFFAEVLASDSDPSWVSLFETPCGLRVRARDGTHSIRCLAASPTSGLSDCEVVIENGTIRNRECTTLRGSSTRILY